MNELRKRNIEILSESGFRVANNLPAFRIDNATRPEVRPKKEIVGRLLALKALWLWVDTHPDAETEATVMEMVQADQLRKHLTPSEASILDLSREEAFAEHGHHMGWKNENCWPLAWALGFPETPSVLVGQLTGELGRRLMLDWLPNSHEESTLWRANCNLRSAREIHELEDLFYCAHNAVRSAQIGCDTVPKDFDPLGDGGCVHERRHALTWMSSPGVSWDETDLST